MALYVVKAHGKFLGQVSLDCTFWNILFASPTDTKLGWVYDLQDATTWPARMAARREARKWLPCADVVEVRLVPEQ